VASPKFEWLVAQVGPKSMKAVDSKTASEESRTVLIEEGRAAASWRQRKRSDEKEGRCLGSTRGMSTNIAERAAPEHA